jgi:RNAse (barnase) inhibitor barstar
MASLLKLLTERGRAGVYQTAIDPLEIVAAAKSVDLEVVRVSLSGACGKTDMLDRFAKALRFPPHFGANWDALNDCLCDLDWLNDKGLVLILTGATDFAESYAEEFRTAIDILNQAAAYWRERKKPFWVLIQAQADLPWELPQIIAD